MPNKIQLLPDRVANQIAAGEVVLRPASVVKELIENALDAGADTIETVLLDAGRTLIQVADNGSGMSPEDARLAFERHATSKIRSVEDLYNLSTMGFRGEALPSIAAVSNVTLRTRQEQDDTGVEISLRASQFQSQEVVQCPKGCNFMVRNLFYNVPARRKFLKRDKTEMLAAVQVFERIVLVNPGVTFTLSNGASTLFSLPESTFLGRIGDVFTKRLEASLIPVSIKTGVCQIEGYVASPEEARRKGAPQFFFANGRYMRHPYFHKAVQQPFQRLVEEGMQVPYFLRLEVPKDTIDVNVHPTKTEIKFEQEAAIFQLLLSAVKNALGSVCGVPEIEFQRAKAVVIPAFEAGCNAAAKEELLQEGGTATEAGGKPQMPPSQGYDPFKTHITRSGSASWEQLVPYVESVPKEPLCFPEEEVKKSGTEAFTGEIMQLKGRFLVTSVSSGLLLVDQHRASMRVLFERYMALQEGRKAASERLVFPEEVSLSASEALVLGDNIDLFRHFGFQINATAERKYLIEAVPQDIRGVNIKRVFKAMLAALMEDDIAHFEASTKERIAMQLSRMGSITQGEVLTREEREALLGDLFATKNPNFTPDGKRIMTVLKDLEAMF